MSSLVSLMSANYSQAASERLQGVLSQTDIHSFAPYRPPSRGFANITENEPTLQTTMFKKREAPPVQGLRQYLEHASRRNGYRKLEVDSLVFKRIPDPNFETPHGFQKAPLGRRNFTPDQAQEQMRVDSESGSIVLHETNMYVYRGLASISLTDSLARIVWGA
jgi:hypothetical protein